MTEQSPLNKSETSGTQQPPNDSVDEASLKYFPERRGYTFYNSLWKKMFLGDPNIQILKCEQRVADAFDRCKSCPSVESLMN